MRDCVTFLSREIFAYVETYRNSSIKAISYLCFQNCNQSIHPVALSKHMRDWAPYTDFLGRPSRKSEIATERFQFPTNHNFI